MKVLIVGSGGVGTIAALALSTNGGAEVTLVVRSDYDHVVKHGYRISSTKYGEISGFRPAHVAPSVQQAAENGPFDYIVVTTKNIPDGPSPCEEIIRPAVTKESTIVLIQNGVGIEGPMITEFPNNIVLSGVSHIGSTNIDCHVVNKGQDRLFLGVFPNPNVDAALAEQKVETFILLYQVPGVNLITRDPDVRQTRWEKLVYNAVMNTTTTIVDLDVNRCQITGANEALFEPAMHELTAIAASEGVTIGTDLHHKFKHIGDGLFYTPSMLVDSRKKQLLELEVILGNPLRIAKKNGIHTPVLSTLYLLLVMVQFRIKEQKGMVQIDPKDYQGDSDKYPEIFKAKQK